MAAVLMVYWLSGGFYGFSFWIGDRVDSPSSYSLFFDSSSIGISTYLILDIASLGEYNVVCFFFLSK